MPSFLLSHFAIVSILSLPHSLQYIYLSTFLPSLNLSHLYIVFHSISLSFSFASSLPLSLFHLSIVFIFPAGSCSSLSLSIPPSSFLLSPFSLLTPYSSFPLSHCELPIPLSPFLIVNSLFLFSLFLFVVSLSSFHPPFSLSFFVLIYLVQSSPSHSIFVAKLLPLKQLKQKSEFRIRHLTIVNSDMRIGSAC